MSEARTARLPKALQLLAGWLLLAAMGLLVLEASRHYQWDERLYDLTIPAPTAGSGHDPVVVVGIDGEFLDGIPEPLGLIHPYLARFFEAMALAGPTVVGLDVVLPSKRLDQLVDSSGAQYHQPLVRALYHLNARIPVVQIRGFDTVSGDFVDPLIDFRMAADNSRLPFAAPFPGAQLPATALLCADSDGVVRRYPSTACIPPDTGVMPLSRHVLSWHLARPVDPAGLLNVHDATAMTYVSLAQVLRWAEAGDTTELQARFAGRAVLLGLVLPWEDRVQIGAPLFAPEPHNRKVPGVFVHAQAIRDAIGGTLLAEPPRVILAGALLLCSLVWFLPSMVWRMTACITLAGLAMVAFMRLPAAGYFLPVTAAGLTLLLAFVSRELLDAWRLHREKQGLVHLFSGYVSPDVMRDILAGRLSPGLNAQRRHLCILFSDIRNFTALSESLPAEELVSLLERYFDRMADAIHRHGGTLDKFIGDGIMAFFGAPQEHPHPERAAFDTAKAMLASLQALNHELVAEGYAPMAIGIGLHAGEVVVGHVGSHSRHEYTAIGDAVNVTARLEGVTKSIGFPVACSERVAVSLPGETFHDAGTLPLKGHSPMRVYGWTPDSAGNPGDGAP